MTKGNLFLAILSLLLSSMSLSNSLYIFVPSETRATVVEEYIKTSCNNLEVTAFGRAKDFSTQVEAQPPTAVLTLLPIIERNNQFETVLKGVKDGVTEEDYVIVSVDDPIDLNDLAGVKVGVVDLLGRKPMTEFVGQLLQSDVRLKRVSKIEDLLPLLSFGTADSLFISESVYESIKTKTQVNLVATRVNIKIGLVSAAVGGGSGKDEVASCIRNFGGEINKILGVDSWL